MARWVDVRIPAGMSTEAVGALVARYSPLTFQLDLRPAEGTGPEVALSVQDVPASEVRVALLAAGVPVLALASRLDSPLEVDPQEAAS